MNMFYKFIPFQGYFHYLSVFRRHIGNKIFFLFGMNLMVVAAESIGIMMLLPLLKVSELGESGLGDKASILLSILEFLGLPQTQLGVLVFIVAVFMIKGLVKFGDGAYRGWLMTRMRRVMQSNLLHYYTQMEYIFYTSRNTGHFINVITIQINRFLQAFKALTQFSSKCITTAGYFVFALFLSWPFTLMAVGGGMIVLILFRYLSEFSKKISRKFSIENSVFQKYLVQILQALKYLASTSSIHSLEKNAGKSIARLTSYQFKLQVAQAFTTAVREPIAVLFLASLLIIQITVLQQPIGPVFISLILFYRAMGTMIDIQGSWQGVMNSVGGIEMVLDEFRDVENNKEIGGKRKISRMEQGITFHNVSFAYDQEPVLHGINLHIPNNSSVAIVGESGAGKSTLVDLITLLLKPSRGQVVIDGVPHTELDYQYWRKNIGFVTQDTVIFDDTIANNISLWTCGYDTNETCRYRVEEAAARAHCHPFIDELTDRYQTVVGDRGVKLSGGQRQRLFVARELFKKPLLLILDEATSSLDTESERYIQKSIDELKGKMTVIIIAHRLSTIRNIDYIYVLEHGRIIEQGTYEDLTSQEDSCFGRMVAMQSL